MTVVMKFGGSILDNAQAYEKMASLVRQYPVRRRAIVVSAMHKATDKLYAIVREKKKSKRAKLLEKLFRGHAKLIDEIENLAIRKNSLKKLGHEYSNLKKAINKIKPAKQYTKKQMEQIVVYGEKFSAILAEAFMLEAGIPCKAWNAESLGIVTDGRFGNAMPLMQKTRKNVRQKILPKLNSTIPIVTGFYGIDRKGKFTTFGRGGSDFSAAVIANCLDADTLLLWKDVNGFLTADPKIVKGTHQIMHLGYNEASELGYFGAKILHPKSIVPLQKINCRLIIRNFNNPQNKGTFIGEGICTEKCFMKCIAFQKGIATLTINSPEFVASHGVLAKVFDAIARKGISVDLVSTSETGVLMTISESEIHHAKEAMVEMGLREKDFTILPKRALVGFIGNNLKFNSGIAGKIFDVLGKYRINIEAISFGPSDINMSFVVSEKDLGRAVNVLHKNFLSRCK